MTRPKVYLTRRLPEEARALVAAACDVDAWPEDDVPVPRDELLRRVAGVDGVLALLTDRIDQELLDAAPRLRAVANMAVGYDNADVPALTRRGVLLTNTPDVLTETTADLVWALMLAAARRIVEGAETIKSGGWDSWSPMFMTGYDVHGATLGIVGAGRIGAAVLRRAQGFGMPLLYHNRRPAPDLEAETGAQYRSLEVLLREADFVVCMLPLTDETRGLFGAAQFALDEAHGRVRQRVPGTGRQRARPRRGAAARPPVGRRARRLRARADRRGPSAGLAAERDDRAPHRQRDGPDADGHGDHGGAQPGRRASPVARCPTPSTPRCSAVDRDGEPRDPPPAAPGPRARRAGRAGR